MPVQVNAYGTYEMSHVLSNNKVLWKLEITCQLLFQSKVNNQR